MGTIALTLRLPMHPASSSYPSIRCYPLITWLCWICSFLFPFHLIYLMIFDDFPVHTSIYRAFPSHAGIAVRASYPNFPGVDCLDEVRDLFKRAAVRSAEMFLGRFPHKEPPVWLAKSDQLSCLSWALALKYHLVIVKQHSHTEFLT